MRSRLYLSHSRFILGICAFQMVTGGIVYWAWLYAGKLDWLRLFFNYQGAIYFILLDVLKVWLCISVWKEFNRREPLGSVWLTISLAMGFQFAGDLLDHWLCVNTYINPLHYTWQKWNPSAVRVLDQWGNAIGGPLFMAILAVGLFKGLQYYKRIGMLGKLKTIDLVVVGGVGIYALYVIVSVVRIAARDTSQIRASWVVTWPNWTCPHF